VGAKPFESVQDRRDADIQFIGSRQSRGSIKRTSRWKSSAKKKGQQGQHEEHEEEDLRDPSGTCSESTETKECSN
jgi:hypothetical protein